MASQLKFKDQLRLQKYKTLLKGIEDSRILSVMTIKDYLALVLVQANYQTYLVFTDRASGEFRGAYHYQREIKSGFISLCAEGPEEVELDEELGLKKIDLATSNGVNSHAQQPKTGDEAMIVDQENHHNH